jgi:hypothetical protein
MAKKTTPKTPAAKTRSTKTRTTRKRTTAKKSARGPSWLDTKSKTPLIDDSARTMQSFLKAMADGLIEKSELQKQEKKLVSLMKKIEPQLDDDLHKQVTQLLCEITVYNIMQMLIDLQNARPETEFRG